MTINKDMISGGVLIVLAILFLSILIPVGVQMPGGDQIAALAPDFWIKIIVWTLLLLGIVLLVEGIQSAKQEAVNEAETVIESDYRDFPGNLIYVALAIVLLFVYYLGVSYLGMMASSIIALLVFTRISGEKRWEIILPIAFIQPVLLYYFFLKVAGIPMPLGIFD